MNPFFWSSKGIPLASSVTDLASQEFVSDSKLNESFGFVQSDTFKDIIFKDNYDGNFLKINVLSSNMRLS